jgi:hypothetical protein
MSTYRALTIENSATNTAAVMALYLVSILCIAVLFSFAACSHFAPPAFKGVLEGGKNVWWRKAGVQQVWLAVVG